MASPQIRWAWSAERASPVPANPVLVRFDPVKQVLVGVTGVLPEMLPCPFRDPELLGFRQGTAAPYPFRQPVQVRESLAETALPR